MDTLKVINKDILKIIPVDLFKIPKATFLTEFRYQSIRLGETVYSLRLPILTPTELKVLIDQLKANQKAYLSHLKVAEIIDWIDQAIQCWTNPKCPQRQLAIKLLPVITGYNAETIKLEIKRFIRIFRKKELLRFVDNELNQPEILDDFHPQKSDSLTKAFGPQTIFNVFSGNIPGLQIWPLIMGTLVKAASLGKTSMAEPLLPVLFVQTLAQINPRLADCMAILPWKGGTQSLESVAATQTGATIVYGSDKAVGSIQPLVPSSKPFLHYGYKISFSMIGREALTPEHYPQTIKRAVEDIAVYDQQSCLSTQAIFIERGGLISPLAAAKLIAAELANYQLKRPRAVLTDPEAAAINRTRNQYQLRSLNDSTIQVLASRQNTDWTVVYHAKAGFTNSPLNRFVHIFQIDQLENVPRYLNDYQPYLQSCGMAVDPNRLYSLADRLGEIGIDRICSLGEMTRARPGWHHDGHFNLLDLLHFVDVEPSMEAYAERFDPDVE